MVSNSSRLLWGSFFHLGYNTYLDRDDPDWFARTKNPHLSAQRFLRFDVNLWNDLVGVMAEADLNMVVIGLGEGVKYDSHPEIAADDAWTVQELRAELARLRRLGIEPIPKLNFSTAHDAWLGPYARCVSTDLYYAVCRDLIAEVIDIFDQPRFFHLGMDEETMTHQQYYNYVVIRQFELYWHDFNFLVGEVEKAGVRPWVWSDYIWDHPVEFRQRMSKSIIQSNWYYDANFDLDIDQAESPRSRRTHGKLAEPSDGRYATPLNAFIELEHLGFDQIPTGSTYNAVTNFNGLAPFSREHISPDHLLGFLQTVWRPVLEEYREKHLESIEIVARTKAAWETQSS